MNRGTYHCTGRKCRKPFTVKRTDPLPLKEVRRCPHCSRRVLAVRWGVPRPITGEASRGA